MALPWRLFSGGAPNLVKDTTVEIPDQGWTLLSAMRHHAFWALFATFFFTAIGMYAIAPQVVAYLIDAGFPPLQAATAWGFSGVVLLFGMLSVSWLDGIIGRRPSVLLSYAISIVGIVLLWLLQWYPNFWMLTGFVVCFGSMIGSRGPLLAATRQGRYAESLRSLVALRAPVNDFFERVMVMDENIARRNNRLALLRDVQSLLGGVADLSRLPG